MATKKTTTSKKKKSSNDDAITKIVAPVWENPDDDDLRAVVGDALLEAGSPWGDLVTLQLKKKLDAAEKKLVKTLTKRHRDLIGGPIAKIASTTNKWNCEKGFLVECELSRRLVKRPDYEAALSAPHWATVKRVGLSILTTPQWWLREWMKNPATQKSLRWVDISNMFLERESTTKPWRVTKCTGAQFYDRYLLSFMLGLSPEDQQKLDYAPNVRAPVRAKLEATLTSNGVQRR
jgi:hypothetical protein